MKDSRLDELAARFNVPREVLDALTAELTPEKIAANIEEQENQGEEFELGSADSAATVQAKRPWEEKSSPPDAPTRAEEEQTDSDDEDAWEALPSGDDAPTIELTPEMIEEIDHSQHISAVMRRHDSVQRIAAEIAAQSPPPLPPKPLLTPAEEDGEAILPEIPQDGGDESSLGNTRSELFEGPHVLRSEQATPMIMTSEGKLFEDLGLLGMGGLGEVRKVRDISLGRSVAMKLLHEEYHHNEAIVARFIEEAQVTAQLQHPGIAPVHEIGRTRDGRLYFTMKEIRGRT